MTKFNEKNNLALEIMEEGREPTPEEHKEIVRDYEKRLKRGEFSDNHSDEDGQSEKIKQAIQQKFGEEYIRWLEEMGVELPDS
jgi:hypothetical protein